MVPGKRDEAFVGLPGAQLKRQAFPGIPGADAGRRSELLELQQSFLHLFRAATVFLRKLVEADPQVAVVVQAAGKVSHPAAERLRLPRTLDLKTE